MRIKNNGILLVKIYIYNSGVIMQNEKNGLVKDQSVSISQIFHILRLRFTEFIGILFFVWLFVYIILNIYKNQMSPLDIQIDDPIFNASYSAQAYVDPIRIISLYSDSEKIQLESNTPVNFIDNISIDELSEKIIDNIDFSKYLNSDDNLASSQREAIINSFQIKLTNQNQVYTLTINTNNDSFLKDFVEQLFQEIHMQYTTILNSVMILVDSRYWAEEVPIGDNIILRNRIVQPGSYIMLNEKYNTEKVLVPMVPSFIKNTIPIFPVSIILSFLVSVVFILIIDTKDDRIFSQKQVRSFYTNNFSFGWIPYRDKCAKNNIEVEDEILMNQCSKIFNGLRITCPDAKVFTFSSGNIGDGKSFVSRNIALACAQSGKKVLLVEDKFIRALTNKYNTSTIADSKTNNELFKIRKTGERFFIVDFNTQIENSNYAIQINNFETFLETERSNFDFIFIDDLAYLDKMNTFQLTRITESVVFVIRVGVTPKNLFLSYIQSIENHRVPICGVILNGIIPELSVEKDEVYYWLKEQRQREKTKLKSRTKYWSLNAYKRIYKNDYMKKEILK